MKRIDVITMGCSKNLVDSEKLMGMLVADGYEVYHDADNPTGNIIIINTCGFIQDAKEESIEMILRFAQAKDEGRVERLYVMGCLSQRYLKELQMEIPQVDHFFGKFDWEKLVEELRSSSSRSSSSSRFLTTPSHYAYLKISEGCSRHCAYCAIPIMTGHHKSRTMEDILAEVRWLVKQGVKEIQVIAQELTFYGVDIYKKRCIAELIERISDVPGVEWIRLHYAYPKSFPKSLLRVMRERENVCNYLDVALQHVSTNVLTNMRRHVSKSETYDFISMLREEVPDIHIRTTLMVGFPGEGSREFQELLDFVHWARFERMGAFAYSEEEGTWAAKTFKDTIKDTTKQKRLAQLMALQQEISAEVQGEKVGKTLRCIIDRREGDYYVGRTEYDSPEVDPEVLIPVKSKRLHVGQFCNIKIIDADEFDLYGE